MQINAVDYFEKGSLLKCRDKVAVRDQNRQVTFAELEVYAKNCAALILERLQASNTPVAVFLPKTVEIVVADLGILYTGNPYANLDTKSPPQRLRGMLDNLAPKIIVTSAAHAAPLRDLGVPEEKLLFIEQAIESQPRYDNTAILERVLNIIDTDPVYVIYTSGSTGVPKGVVISHRGVVDFIDWVKECYDIRMDEIIGNQAPFFFDISSFDLFICFACGTTLVLIPEELFVYPVKLIEFVRQAEVTTIFWVPSIMTNVARFKFLDSGPLPPLRKILFAGEVMPTRTLNYWRKCFPKALFSNLYGPTETTVISTYYIVDRELNDQEQVPIGIPCRNTDILILNESNQPAAVNEAGELCVRGTSLALGYWKNPKQTEQVFVQNPLNPNYPELIYRTGDIVSRNARGEIMYIGRKDHQIKHMGYRIELGEIEHATSQVDGIQSCCVVYNQIKKEITLFYECGSEITPAFIRERLALMLPKYMLPTAFHRMESIPRNQNGKIHRLELMSNLLERVSVPRVVVQGAGVGSK